MRIVGHPRICTMRTKLHCCLVPIVSLVRKISPLKSAKSCAIWKKRSPRELFPNRIPRVSAEETWSYDDRDSSSPLYCSNCMMIGLCSCVVQMLMCTGEVALYKSWHSKYHPKPSWLYSSLLGITCGRVILLTFFPRKGTSC